MKVSVYEDGWWDYVVFLNNKIQYYVVEAVESDQSNNLDGYVKKIRIDAQNQPIKDNFGNFFYDFVYGNVTIKTHKQIKQETEDLEKRQLELKFEKQKGNGIF